MNATIPTMPRIPAKLRRVRGACNATERSARAKLDFHASAPRWLSKLAQALGVPDALVASRFGGPASAGSVSASLGAVRVELAESYPDTPGLVLAITARGAAAYRVRLETLADSATAADFIMARLWHLTDSAREHAAPRRARPRPGCWPASAAQK
jgi:hypothetical protein